MKVNGKNRKERCARSSRKSWGTPDLKLNGGLKVGLKLSDVKAGIEGRPTIKGDRMTVHTCDGKLSAQPFLTFNADFFVNFEVLGVEVWSKEAEIAKKEHALTDGFQVKSLSIKGAAESR